MLKIKISSPEKHKQYDISQYVGNVNNTIDGCQFFINDSKITQADYWFCSEDISPSEERCIVSPSNVFFVTSEVAWSSSHYRNAKKIAFLKQFSKIFTCHPIFLPNVEYKLPFLPWMINANHGPSLFEANQRDLHYLENLNYIEKTKSISVFCSNQTFTEDHRLRLSFVQELKKHFGEALDWYGNGINPLPKKWDGIAPYKYHIVLENKSKNNIITEKLYDSFLGLSYPIYYGAPNVDNYFDSNSFDVIDLADLSGSIQKIEGILKSDLYESRLPHLIKSKNQVVNEFNIFKRFAKIANDHARQTETPCFTSKKEFTIKRSDQFKTADDLRQTLRSEGLRGVIRKVSLYYSAKLLRLLSDRLLQKY